MNLQFSICICLSNRLFAVSGLMFATKEQKESNMFLSCTVAVQTNWGWVEDVSLRQVSYVRLHVAAS